MTDPFFVDVDNKGYWFISTEMHGFDVTTQLDFKVGTEEAALHQDGLDK
jgi:hypothetical protein